MPSGDSVGASTGVEDASALLSILQGYPSASEVKYLIDEALDKFVEKRLTSLVVAIFNDHRGEVTNGAAATPESISDAQGREATETGSPRHSPSKNRSGGGAVDADWLSMVVRSQLETELLQQTQLLVRSEVARQLKDTVTSDISSTSIRHPSSTLAANSVHALSASPPPSARPPRPPATLSPPRATHLAAAGEEDCLTARSPPPSKLFRGLEDDADSNSSSSGEEGAKDGHRDGGTGAGSVRNREGEETQGTGDSPAASSSAVAAEDAGRKQRERILSAIHDVEHQLNSLQRQVNELSHQHRLGQQRAATLFAAAHGGEEGRERRSPQAPQASPNTSISSTNYSTFYATLLQALDERELSKVRCMARETVAALLPSLSADGEGDGRLAAPTDVHASPSSTPLATQQQPPPPPAPPLHQRQPLTALDGAEGGRAAAGERLATPLPSNISTVSDAEEDLASQPTPLSQAATAVGIVASGGRGGDTVPPPPPSLQTSQAPSAAAKATSEAATGTSRVVAAQLSKGGAVAQPVQIAARQLASLLESGSGTRRPYGDRAAVHTPVDQTLRSSRSGDSPPPITGSGAWARTGEAQAPRQQHPYYQPEHQLRSSPVPHHTEAAAVSASSSGTQTPVRDYVLAAAVGHHHSRAHSQQQRSPRSQWSTAHSRAGGDLTLGIDAIDLPAGVLPCSLGLRGGVRVLAVGRGQIAERSGIVAGDVIIAVTGSVVETCAQLQNALMQAQAQSVPLKLDLYRHTANLVFTITLDI